MSKADVYAILVALWTSGILTSVALAVIKLIKANTKNKHVLLFTQWAEQAVQYAETHGKSSDDKKKKANEILYDRLIANKIPFAFSDEQVDAVIESAVAKLHDWHPEVKEKK
jgi:hypothetical protein